MLIYPLFLLATVAPAPTAHFIAPPKALAKIELHRFANIPNNQYSVNNIGTVLTLELEIPGQGGVAIDDIPPGSLAYFSTEAHGRTAQVIEPYSTVVPINFSVKASIFSRLPNNQSITLSQQPKVVIKAFAVLSPAYASSSATIILDGLTAHANLPNGSPSDFKNIMFPTLIPNGLGIERSGSGSLELVQN